MTDIRQLDLRQSRISDQVSDLLKESGLRLEGNIGYFAGMFDSDDNLIGCGGIDGNVIKCLALSGSIRGEGYSACLISHLINEILCSGHSNVRVFTKPEYKTLFSSLGFSTCGEGRSAVMLESDRMPLMKYSAYLAAHKADGVIIANANPMTRGHLHLITTAAAMSRRLAVIAVGPDPGNLFEYSDRVAMLKKGTSHLKNVEILEGSEYVISRLSFPSYFIKKADETSRSQAELDLDIFRRHIAPALGCVRRFVGTEPTDALTSQYNSMMKELLPPSGIEAVEIERLEDNGIPLSATCVRNALEKGRLHEALPMVPVSDTPYLLSFLAIRALRKELWLSPKPGLVDRYDRGSHSDMDYGVMSRSIDSLRGFFRDVAVTAFENPVLDTDLLRKLGMDAENTMLKATGGINTHRGAIFSMGLAVAASARILSGNSRQTIDREIASIARSFPVSAGNTHGQAVRQRYNIPGALENARAGYSLLFKDWLPFYRNSSKTDEDCLRLLLKIISSLDDSNAIYRAGIRKADEARRKAAEVMDYDDLYAALTRLNEEFKHDNISHGGAADMLALTLFTDSIYETIINQNP